MCDDGVLRDLKAVFGKYHMSQSTEKALKILMSLIKDYKPDFVKFLYDSPVSRSGELAGLTDSLLKNYEINGTAVTRRNVDYELVKESKLEDGIVASSDGAIIDKVDSIVDIPYWILARNCLDLL